MQIAPRKISLTVFVPTVQGARNMIVDASNVIENRLASFFHTEIDRDWKWQSWGADFHMFSLNGHISNDKDFIEWVGWWLNLHGFSWTAEEVVFENADGDVDAIAFHLHEYRKVEVKDL